MEASRRRNSLSAFVVGVFAWIGFGIALGTVASGSASAQAPINGDTSPRPEALQQADVDAGAVMLAANPKFKDPMWAGTVLLATPLPNGGHVGVIINRPTELKLGQLFPEHGPSHKVVDPVYFGGPFHANLLVAVIRAGNAPEVESIAMTADMRLAIKVDVIDRVIEQTPASARYYIGVVLWRPGELKAELSKQLWSVHGASSEVVFRKNLEHLWDELSAPKRGTSVSAPRPVIAFAHGLANAHH